jgi:hypothetical protein
MKNRTIITITLTEDQKAKAKEISKSVLGRENVSGLFAFWINTFKQNKSKS